MKEVIACVLFLVGCAPADDRPRDDQHSVAPLNPCEAALACVVDQCGSDIYCEFCADNHPEWSEFAGQLYAACELGLENRCDQWSAVCEEAE